MTDRTSYVIPKEPGRWRAIGLAAAVHAALIAFLWIGVHWQSQVPVAVEAEVWSPEAREAAPRPPPVAPPEPPAPVEKPIPQPVPKPVIQEPPPPPPPKVVQPVLPDPEIALEKERKRKAQEQKARDQAAQAEQAREDKERKQVEQEKKDAKKLAEKQAEKLADKLAEKQAEKLDKQKAADARKKDEADKKQAADALAKLKQKQDAAKKAESDKQRKADDAAENKRHDDDMKRLLGQAAGTGASTSTGTAAKSQGPRGGDPGYAQKVGAKIKNNIRFPVPDGMTGNPSVEYEVQLLPDGSVASIRLRKPSGIPGFDDAVKLAIERSAPYPKDNSGSVPSSFIGIHKPKDQ
ncbi:cell envelope integrity protein TolA [Glaciimonas immobilis]|uniref:Colicin import membrane protein n=1 Tax=Glaciimonas immobilis TaxID=728004 RepID=A0A840RXF0_9BURK|nr:cell envelope integrity protein TolA [Glaciimonas immobilis]KAF3996089.1 cell envelope integrity protein TolA [Glaciimonas immobilis]MBB5201768.1 colicin import membrane protein [Glaciimonas immobilis]